jgi:ribosome biogenesis GTPase A
VVQKIFGISNFREVSTARQEFENELHLGRACSRYKIDENQIKKWKKQIGKIPSLKLTVPEELLFSQPKYEVDALNEIHSRSYDCNVMLEIRDVRVPASSHHPSFTRLGEHRLHLICYTHADMIDQETRDRVEKWTLKFWKDARCIFLDTRENRSFATKSKNNDANDDNVEEVQQSSPYDLVYDSLLDHLEEKGGINAALTVGVANTGKSSLLMALLRTARLRGDLKKKGLKGRQTTIPKKGKKKKKSKVLKLKGNPLAIEDRPGKTREITEYLLREKPKAFFLDVPGMTPPKFFFRERPEAWFAFGAANLIPLGKRAEQDVELQSAFCQFVLHAMNRDYNFGYVVKLGLTGPTNELITVLNACKKPKEHQMNPVPEHVRLKQCQTFLKLFNTGNFGPVILDDLSKPYQKFIFKDSHFKKDTSDDWKRGPQRKYVDGFGDHDDFSDKEGIRDGENDDSDDEDSFYKT